MGLQDKGKMSRFLEHHLAAFRAIPYVEQGPFNHISPYQWAQNYLGLNEGELRALNLPVEAVARPQVRTACRPGLDVVRGYVIAMAWGAQEKGPGGAKKVREAWGGRQQIRSHLERIQTLGLSRREAFGLFEQDPIRYLGPAYFTKLIYFFSPYGDAGRDRYIMDKWTGKSINLLTGEHIVQLTKSPSKAGEVDHVAAQSNTADNYEAFCREVDALAVELNVGAPPHRVFTGEMVERMLFSMGGRDPEPWRRHVATAWAADHPKHRYRKSLVTDRLAREWP